MVDCCDSYRTLYVLKINVPTIVNVKKSKIWQPSEIKLRYLIITTHLQCIDRFVGLQY